MTDFGENETKIKGKEEGDSSEYLTTHDIK